MEAVDALWQQYNSTLFIKMCRDILRKRLFSDGIQFFKGFKTKSQVVPDLQMSEIIEDYWIPFARDALDCILVMGFVPFKLFSVEEESIPIIPSPGTYSVYYKIDETGTMRLSAQTKGHAPQKLQVMSGFGYNPTESGSITSIAACCTPNCVFVNSLHDEILISEFLKNNPVLYSESQQKVLSETEGVSYDFFADAQELKRLPSTTFKRSEHDIQQLTAQRQAYSKALAYVRQTRGKTSAQLFAEKNAAGALDRLVPLPPGQKLVKMPHSSARNDFVNILRSKQDELASAFGIPRSMVMNDTTAKSDTSGQHELFRSTVLFWQSLLGRLMTAVHSSINSGKHKDALKKIQSKENGTNKRDLYKLKEKECILIHFPISIFGTTNEELKELYEEEIIDRVTYATYRLKNAGLSIDLLYRKDDPLTSQEKKNQYVETPKVTEQKRRFDDIIPTTNIGEKKADKEKEKKKDNEKETKEKDDEKPLHVNKKLSSKQTASDKRKRDSDGDKTSKPSKPSKRKKGN